MTGPVPVGPGWIYLCGMGAGELGSPRDPGVKAVGTGCAPPHRGTYTPPPETLPRERPRLQSEPPSGGYGSYPLVGPYYPHGVPLPGEPLPCARSPGAEELGFYACQAAPPYINVAPGAAPPGSESPADAYSPWPSPTHWEPRFRGPKERLEPRRMWKASSPDIAPLQPEGGGYRRGRKKRAPYTKVQLKELEREYATSKFITREKRRKISGRVNLSERQVTIWFQNRRVKEKKMEARSGANHLQTI